MAFPVGFAGVRSTQISIELHVKETLPGYKRPPLRYRGGLFGFFLSPSRGWGGGEDGVVSADDLGCGQLDGTIRREACFLNKINPGTQQG